MNQENNNYNFDPMTGQPIKQQSQQVINPFENNVQQEVNNKPNNKKKIILLIVGILIIGLVIILVLYLTNNGNINDEEGLKYVFDPDKPIIIKENGKYGYITSNGEEMIKVKYNYAEDFYGNYAVVKMNNPDDDDYFEEVYQIIDKKGKEQLEKYVYSEPQYIAEYDRWIIDGKLYNGKLKLILENEHSVTYKGNGYFSFNDYINNKSGIINHKGKEIFTWDGSLTSVEVTDNPIDKNTYARVSSYEERDIIINLKTGKTVFNLENPQKYYINANSNGIFEIYNSDEWETDKFIYIQNNKVVYETEKGVENLSVYDVEKEILKIDYGYDYDNYESIYKYYDLKNKKILSEEPAESDDDYSELKLIETTYGFKPYRCEYNYGLTKDGESLLPCEYEDIEMLDYNLFAYMKNEHNKELVLLEKDDKTILYDLKEGKGVKSFKSDYVYDNEGSTFLNISEYDENYQNYTTVYNLLTNKSKTFSPDEKINIYSNYIILKKEDKNIYYNTELEKIYETKNEE